MGIAQSTIDGMAKRNRQNAARARALTSTTSTPSPPPLVFKDDINLSVQNTINESMSQTTSTWISCTEASRLSTSTGPHSVRDCHPSSPSPLHLFSLQGAATSEDRGSISPARGTWSCSARLWPPVPSALPLSPSLVPTLVPPPPQMNVLSSNLPLRRPEALLPNPPSATRLLPLPVAYQAASPAT